MDSTAGVPVVKMNSNPFLAHIKIIVYHSDTILKKLDDSVGKIVDIYKVRDVDLGVMMSRQLQLFANTKIYL